MDDDELMDVASTPFDEREPNDGPIFFKWVKPPGSGLDDCVLCRKPTQSHQLEVETAPLTGFALVICHSCYDEHDGDGGAILQAWEAYSA